jgi:hypothetical protein
VPVADVLDDWTRTFIDELAAVHLADLERGPTTYRVFLLPDALQFDLSLTPAARFRPAGPRFRLLFGETAAGDAEAPKPPVAAELFIRRRLSRATSSGGASSRSGNPSPPPFSHSWARPPEARLPHADTVAQRLAELLRP